MGLVRLTAGWFAARLRVRSILRRTRVEQELDEELQFHLENKIEEGVAQGLSPKEARYRALRAMDGLEQRKDEMRDMRRIHWLMDFIDDTRYAIRSLRRTPGLTAFVIDYSGAWDRHGLRHFQHGGCADLQALPRAASERHRHPGEHHPRQQLR